MNRTVLLCAHNPKNAGMYSVDLAGKQFFENRQRKVELCVTQHKNKIGKLSFKRIRSVSPLTDVDSIVYWGDFQNNPMWGWRDFSRREVGYGDADTHESAFGFWREFYLEAGKTLPESSKLYSVGGCFQGMQDYLDIPGVRESFEYFLQRASAIIVRDSISYATLTNCFSPKLTRNVKLGYDVSCLLNVESFTINKSDPYFAWSFGRSGLSPDDEMKIVAYIEMYTGLKAVKIDWLNPKLLFGSRHFFNRPFMRMLRMISGARFIVTDIYHMTLNSLNVGTPPLVLYQSQRGSGSFGTLLDDKKQSLLSMLNAGSFLFDWDESRDVVDNVSPVLRMANMIMADHEIGDAVLAAHKQKKQELISQLTQIF